MASSGDEGIKKKFFWDLKRIFLKEPEVDGLLQGFQNVGLKSIQIDTFSVDSKELSSDCDENTDKRNMQYPIRPHADDCSFFVRTGTCKFGPACKFNHPPSNLTLVDQEKSDGNGVETASKNPSQIPCKFYANGLCKYGESCRFSHSKSEAEKSPLQLNVLGFPKRMGKVCCSFYMRTGMCGYGASCRFHHPDPILYLEPELYSSVITGESNESYLSSPLTTPGNFLYMHQNCVLSGYQVLLRYSCSNLYTYYGDLESMSNNSAFCWKGSEGKQEVRSFSAPPAVKVEMVEDHPSKGETCDLNDVGLSIRPGKKVCWHYKKLGLCKSGRACAYDHPRKHSSTDVPTSDTSSGSRTEETHK